MGINKLFMLLFWNLVSCNFVKNKMNQICLN
nr:MAG TPA: hypothetical protein [Crassvirales sp.]